MIPVLGVHDGPHGVAVYARELAAAVTARSSGVQVRRIGDLGAAAGVPVHVHFTDRLWGRSPEDAAVAFQELAARHPVTATLHDVPQSSDGERNRMRRRESYAAVASAARAVAVNSEHERMLLREEGVWAGPASVLPLPVEVTRTAEARPAPDGAVGVLGYFYPGKGHDEALAAAHAIGMDRLAVLGRASAGHGEDLAAFVRRAEASGVAVEVTGWLEERALAARARRVSVPVIAHRHISASGSLAAWIGYGRRPVAVAHRYVEEMATLRPGTIRAVPADALAEAIDESRRHPALTWHGLEAAPWDAAEVADAYLRWWGRP